MEKKWDQWKKQETGVHLKQALFIFLLSWIYTFGSGSIYTNDWSIYEIYTLCGVPFALFVSIIFFFIKNK